MEQPSTKGANNQCGKEIPGEKIKNSELARVTFLPSDTGVEKKSQNSGADIADQRRHPKKVIVFYKITGDESVNKKIKQSQYDADDDIFTNTGRNRVFGFFAFHILILSFRVYI